MNRRIPVPTPPMSRGSTAAATEEVENACEWMQQALSMRLACEFVPRFSSKASLTSLAAAACFCNAASAAFKRAALSCHGDDSDFIGIKRS